MKKSVFAKKSFGQNFLVDKNYIEKIIAELNPQKGETIIEIGAGRGALTEKLLATGAEIIAIELERDMIKVLKEKFAGAEKFTLIEKDALKVDFTEFILSHRQVKLKPVGNLPYNISTAILQKIIEQREVFSEAILMLQREVVERITAKAGNAERGFLSVMVEAYCTAEKLFDVPPNAFLPVPKVWSSLVRLSFNKSEKMENETLFRQIVSAGFTQRRKTILNNLKNAPEKLREILDKKGGATNILQIAEIDAARRAETLTLEEWTRLESEIRSLSEVGSLLKG